ncbi:energy-coupling factor ABC transporter ATP-binding protein [Paramaledivibacter caminithermalis]|jgi:energy-coupling factor transport system ATP-binding protein|uniref:Energy-coupling factor transport system ATP-binding protein n=1 Tax=Paramaledivibacter caminithermalis (strain DSM 15212 / CIP 107654 / DViRD3) TaxID=1121301 RepID=A0A1M6QT06_PARC5|nr:ABC transporter ATP-binding protein [Paramaledivibacter caminithermalis]SHK23238.1 energy-coupling factor transport system ATP-binding protein [Paramaledivibacter caminithermalis DSM 15212]
MTYIEAKNIDFAYPKRKKVINDISLKIYKKDITTIIGHNGGGKTTLGKLLAGILKPIDGDVFICGNNTKDMSLGQVGKKIGYLFQNPSRQIFTTNVCEELLFLSKLGGKESTEGYGEMERLLNFFELWEKKDEFTFNLSYGEKQRLALAAILMNKPEFLILDEPTTGLDKLRKTRLSRYLTRLEEEGVGMIIISHDLDFVKAHASRRIEIARGEIINDTR